MQMASCLGQRVPPSLPSSLLPDSICPCVCLARMFPALLPLGWRCWELPGLEQAACVGVVLSCESLAVKARALYVVFFSRNSWNILFLE